MSELTPEQVDQLAREICDGLYLWSTVRTNMLTGVSEMTARAIAPVVAAMIDQAWADGYNKAVTNGLDARRGSSREATA